jgi:hypothetical protein
MENKDCCGTRQGIIFGLLPHSFCFGLILFSVLGATIFTTIFRGLLLLPHFLEILMGLSFILATMAALIYFQRLGGVSLEQIKNHGRYLGILYGTTIMVNLVLLNFVFPAAANFGQQPTVLGQSNLVTKTLAVQIPCSGHALLISGELKKVTGVANVYFNPQGNFEVSFDPRKVTIEQILGIPIFRTYAARVLS